VDDAIALPDNTYEGDEILEALDMSQNIGSQLQQILNKLEALETKFETAVTTVNNLTSTVDVLKTTVDKVQRKVTAVESKTTKLWEDVECLTSTMQGKYNFSKSTGLAKNLVEILDPLSCDYYAFNIEN